MTTKIFKSENFIYIPFSALTEEQKEIIAKSWSNPFNARYNAMADAKGDILEISQLAEPTFQDLNNYYDCMYFRVVLDKNTSEIIGTCRFGKFYKSKTNDCWDFGFNCLLKHWQKGYGVQILRDIIKFSKQSGVKSIVGSADIENFGSYKAMIKNGFIFDYQDNDGDYHYILSLDGKAKTEAEINQIWDDHIKMTQKDLGIDKFNRLELINNKIKEMVLRIQAGEDEDSLVLKYFEELNQIEEFKFC